MINKQIVKIFFLFAIIVSFNFYSCKKEPDPLALTTVSASAITYSTAISGGNITSDGGSAITSRGVCWSISQGPTTSDSKTEDGSGTGTFSSTLTDLTPETSYYVRAYATNSEGTNYGDEVSFTTGQLTDINGNVYNTVTIGTQVWMKENLKATKYNDGADIPYVTDNNTWFQTNDPGYTWYNNDEATYGGIYGAMYNWYTVNTGKLCPGGWHVPTDAEWTILTDFPGGEEIAGGKLKEAGTEHWGSPNTEATNESGFTALPGGYLNNGGNFYSIGFRGDWWTSTMKDNVYVWRRTLQLNSGNISRYDNNKNFGLSVRCIKDL
jgi:uncharacterized protein (TIGR02145 family)